MNNRLLKYLSKGISKKSVHSIISKESKLEMTFKLAFIGGSANMSD